MISLFNDFADVIWIVVEKKLQKLKSGLDPVSDFCRSQQSENNIINLFLFKISDDFLNGLGNISLFFNSNLFQLSRICQDKLSKKHKFVLHSADFLDPLQYCLNNLQL